MNFPEWVDIVSPRRYRLLIKMQFWARETFLQVIVQRGPRGLQNSINYYHMPWLSAMTTWQDPEMQRMFWWQRSMVSWKGKWGVI